MNSIRAKLRESRSYIQYHAKENLILKQEALTTLFSSGISLLSLCIEFDHSLVLDLVKGQAARGPTVIFLGPFDRPRKISRPVLGPSRALARVWRPSPPIYAYLKICEIMFY